MPLYEFSCLNCKFKFEELLSVEEKNPQCPQCKGEVQKLISRCLGIIKGSENRLLDCVIGAGAEKRWQAIEKRREKRLKKRLKKLEKK